MKAMENTSKFHDVHIGCLKVLKRCALVQVRTFGRERDGMILIFNEDLSPNLLRQIEQDVYMYFYNMYVYK